LLAGITGATDLDDQEDGEVISAAKGEGLFVGDYTFEIDLSRPDPYFLEYMSLNSDMGIIPQGWLAQCGQKCDTTVVGTGPFTVKEWVRAITSRSSGIRTTGTVRVHTLTRSHSR